MPEPAPSAVPVTPAEIVGRMRDLVNIASAATGTEHETVTALESQLQREGEAVDSASIFATMRAILNRVGDVTRCKDCGQTIWFVPTRHGRRAPYTAAGLNHFADCPGAGSFRRPKPGKGGRRGR